MLVASSPDDSRSQALNKILQAAEIEFAQKGFDGAGMKAIAVRAGVSQSLLHYHFGSKDQLYGDVVRHRSKLINDERLERLQAVDLDQDLALNHIFEALFVPALGPAGGGRTYARIFAGMIAGAERDQKLVRECYDPTAQVFIHAIQQAVSDIDQRAAGQIYQFGLGVLVSVISRDGRVERLMGEESNRLEEAALVQRITQFVVGGAMAVAAVN